MTAKAVIYNPFLWDSRTEQQPEQAGGFHIVGKQHAEGGKAQQSPQDRPAEDQRDHGKQDAAGACQHLTEGKAQKI